MKDALKEGRIKKKEKETYFLLWFIKKLIIAQK